MAEQGEQESTGKGNESETKGGLLAMPFPRFLMLFALLAQLIAIVLFVGPSPSNLMFVMPFIIPILLFAALALTKGRPWMFLASGIMMAVFPTLVLIFSLDSFANPLLGIVFAAGMFLLMGLFLGLPTGVWVLRHQPTPPPMSARDGLRTRYGVFTVLVCGLLLGSAMAGVAAREHATASGSGSSGADLTAEASVTITAENYLFAPTNVSIPVGKLVEVSVVNKDNALHTFTYTVYKGTANEKTYNHQLLPSATLKFTMLISTAGTTHFWCIPHESMGMVGDFTVA